MPANTFLGVFAKSPLKPLEKHINVSLKACKGLIPFFEAVYAQDWKEAQKKQKEISQYENDADAIKRDIRINLPGNVFLPVQRTDLLELLTQQDKLANLAKDIAGRVLGRELEIPEAIQNEFANFLERSIDATKKAKKVINELDELLETGFRGKEVETVERLIANIDAIEDDTDALQIKLRRSLKSIESELNPVDTIFLYDIIEWVGDLADIAERVGSRLELMLAR